MAIFTGRGVVWDKERNKILCKFVDGSFETTDERTKNILNGLKFPCDNYDEIVIVEDEEVIEHCDNSALAEQDIEELKAYCKEKGYRGYGNIQDVEKLIEFIQKREGD